MTIQTTPTTMILHATSDRGDTHQLEISLDPQGLHLHATQNGRHPDITDPQIHHVTNHKGRVSGLSVSYRSGSRIYTTPPFDLLFLAPRPAGPDPSNTQAR